jgi:hypothetical protein
MFSINWKKKAQEVDKTLKPESEKYKAAGEDGGIKINPSPNTIGTNVQQHIEKLDIPISDAQKIPASEVKKYTKAELEKQAAEGKTTDPNAEQYKASGEVEKLQFPTKTDAAPSVKQPGLETGKDAAGKEYKDPGQKEKLEVPTKQLPTPDTKIVVVTDEKLGTEFKPAGDSEKIMTKPKEFKGPAGQPMSEVSPLDYMHKHERTKPMQKQFAAINWFKRDAVSPEAQEFISKKIKKNVEEGKPQEQAIAVAHSQAREEGYEVPEKKSALSNNVAEFIIKAAASCPECFDKLVAYIYNMRPKAALTPEEATELKTYTDAASKGPLTSEQKTRMEALSAKACQYVEEHERRHHGEPEKSEELEDETGKALEEMSKA